MRADRSRRLFTVVVFGVILLGIIPALVSVASAAPPAPIKLGIVVLPDEARQIEYSIDYGLLFVRNSDNDIRIIDTTTNEQIGFRAANEMFTDLDLTPDERYLYAADYGGTAMGSDRPTNQHYVHRFDLATRTWETGMFPKIVYRIEGVDADKFLVQEQDQHVDMMLNRFAPTTVVLSRIGADYSGDCEYDHTTGRVVHGNSSGLISVRRIVDDTLVYEETTGNYDSAEGFGGSCVLSTDFQYFYYGRLQVDAQDVKRNRNVFYGNIYAASSDIAFGSNRYYDVETTRELGSLGFDSTVYGISGDGRELWAYREFGNVLFHYDLVPEPATMGMLVLGGLVVLRRRRGK
jgi:hypothetical protein